MKTIVYVDCSTSTQTLHDLGIIADLWTTIKSAFEKMWGISEISKKQAPFLSEAIYDLITSQQDKYNLTIGVFITNSYADNGTMHMAIEALLQQQLHNTTFVLLVNLPGQEKILAQWMSFLATGHPSRDQIDVRPYDENATRETILGLKLQKWIESKQYPFFGSSTNRNDT